VRTVRPAARAGLSIGLANRSTCDETSAVSHLSDVAVITAACDSPFAAHRIPTLGVALLVAFVAEERLTDGTSASLTTLLDAAAGWAPEVRAHEGWWPSDPRLTVTAAFAGQRWRLHPGWMRMSTDIVETVFDVAYALDPAAEQRLGFRATDLVELSLRYMDAGVRNAAPHWPDRSRTEPDRERLARDPVAFTLATLAIPAVVTPEEIAAARCWVSADRLGDAATRCSNSDRALRAAEWATLDHRGVPRKGMNAHLAVRASARRWACPASLVLSRLDPMMSRLHEEVGDAERRSGSSGARSAGSTVCCTTTCPSRSSPATRPTRPVRRTPRSRSAPYR
jgi:hypothetical protein